MITVTPRYLEHSSGSKYYEVLILQSATQDVIVKRYGPMGQFMKPGTGIEPHVDLTKLKAQTASSRIEEEIRPKLTKSKGYKRVGVEYGFHRAMSGDAYDLDNEEFFTKCAEHFSSEFTNVIAGHLGIGGRQNGMQTQAVKQDKAPEASSRSRGDSWGSW
jgi:hypothetical protein